MQESKYKFFLNKYVDYGATKCTNCDTPTKIRKFPLFISYANKYTITLNLPCKFCTNCELIIAKKNIADEFLKKAIEKIKIKFEPDNYEIIGTIDRKTFWKHNKRTISDLEIFDKIAPFIEILDFEIQPAGWYFE